MTWKEQLRQIYLNTGFTTLLNYRHINLPPLFKTLLASASAFLVRGTFLNPKDMVQASKVLSGNGSSSAFPQTNQIYYFFNPICLAFTSPSSSMDWLISNTIDFISWLMRCYFDGCDFIRYGMKCPLCLLPHPTLLFYFNFPFNIGCWAASCPAISRTSFSSSDGFPSTLHHSLHHICLLLNGILNQQAIAQIKLVPAQNQNDYQVYLAELRRVLLNFQSFYTQSIIIKFQENQSFQRQLNFFKANQTSLGDESKLMARRQELNGPINQVANLGLSYQNAAVEVSHFFQLVSDCVIIKCQDIAPAFAILLNLLIGDNLHHSSMRLKTFQNFAGMDWLWKLDLNLIRQQLFAWPLALLNDNHWFPVHLNLTALLQQSVRLYYIICTFYGSIFTYRYSQTESFILLRLAFPNLYGPPGAWLKMLTAFSKLVKAGIPQIWSLIYSKFNNLYFNLICCRFGCFFCLNLRMKSMILIFGDFQTAFFSTNAYHFYHHLFITFFTL